MQRIVNFAALASAAAALCVAMAATSSAQTLTTLFLFDGKDGLYPAAPLIQATDGNLYGTTTIGGKNGGGGIFKLSTSGAETLLYSFPYIGGWGPSSSGLAQAADGNFYGTCYGDGTIFEMTANGKVTILGEADYPNGLIYTNGVFYGTSGAGGTYGEGTVFKITASGNLTTLYNFCAESECPDGAGPGTLVLASDGNFYGTTSGGGAYGHGTVFDITPAGALTTLYNFCAQSGCPDGENPGTLVQASNGNFFGTTLNGGANKNSGTIFKITSSGVLTTLYSFCAESGCADGQYPNAGLIQATDGDFYGTTQMGGPAPITAGTVFKITSHGKLTTLWSFCSETDCADGTGPRAGLLQDTNGDFYGTTYYGGSSGSVFSLSVGLEPFVEPQTASGAVGSRFWGPILAGRWALRLTARRLALR